MRDFAVAGGAAAARLRESDIESNFGQSVIDLGTVDGTLYGFLFKAANKSLVWYNVPAYSDAGVEPAEDWDTWIRRTARP